jgi:hypothetical protein
MAGNKQVIKPIAGTGIGIYTAVEQRRIDILNMMLTGATHSQIKQWYTTYHPVLSEHSCEKDITYAYGELKKYANTSLDDIISHHIIFYDEIAQKATSTGQYDSAIKAKQAKEKLLKMHAPEAAVFVQNNNMSLDHLTKDDLAEVINKLINPVSIGTVIQIPSTNSEEES